MYNQVELDLLNELKGRLQLFGIWCEFTSNYGTNGKFQVLKPEGGFEDQWYSWTVRRSENGLLEFITSPELIPGKKLYVFTGLITGDELEGITSLVK